MQDKTSFSRMIEFILILMTVTWLSYHALVNLYVNVANISLTRELTHNIETRASENLFSFENWTIDKARPRYLEQLTAVCIALQHRRACFSAGIWNLGLTRYDTAYSLFDHMYFGETTDELLVWYMGGSQWASGDKEAALYTWQEGRNIDKYFALKGAELYEAQAFEEALEVWKASDALSKELSIQKTAMYTALCEVGAEQGDELKALQWCENALTVNSSWPIHYAVVHSMLEMGELDRALQTARSLVQRQDELSFSGRNQSYRLLAVVYEKQGEYILAIEQYKRVQQPDQFVLFELSQTYLKANLIDEAVDTLQEIVRIEPTTNVAKQAQTQLDSLLSQP
jgi:tetratricopeptide (TPR) repeat protein